MMAETDPISPELDALTCDLIGCCLDVLAEGEELWPTLSYCGAGYGADESAERGSAECISFDDDGLEECLQAARDKVAALPSETTCYALAYNGFVQMDQMSGTQDALIVEFGERGARTAYSAYIPYHTGKTPDEFSSGEPLAAGEEPLLFK